MSYILDTHTLLWWFEDPMKLSKEAREIISKPSNIVMVSSVSIWEIVIKRSLGKLEVSDKIFDLINEENFNELPIVIDHARRLASLQEKHKDPFDRLLISQALCEKAAIITRDKEFKKYPIKLVKA